MRRCSTAVRSVGGERIVLDANAQRLWSEYLEAEQDRVRDVLMPALDRFLAAFALQDEVRQEAWALHLAACVVDQGADTPVRFPLFERILLPALAVGVTNEQPGCARWLAHFDHLLVHCRQVALPDHLTSVVGLLTEAVRLDPSDRKARQALVCRLGSHFEYTLHELPSGVLYGHNGASVAQCDELLAELADFREHVHVLGETARYAELIEECALHYRRYREYLASGRPGGSYARFLETHDGDVTT